MQVRMHERGDIVLCRPGGVSPYVGEEPEEWNLCSDECMSFKKERSRAVACRVLLRFSPLQNYGWQARCLIASEHKGYQYPFTQRKTFHKERNLSTNPIRPFS
jgi:hypothetical protein